MTYDLDHSSGTMSTKPTLSTNDSKTTTDSHYEFQHKISKVAVIGAGAAGIPAARHLRDSGLTVRVFERQSTAGGVWNWQPDVAPPLGVPTPPPSRGAFTPVVPGAGDEDVGSGLEALRLSNGSKASTASDGSTTSDELTESSWSNASTRSSSTDVSEDLQTRKWRFSPPNPVYWSLTNNVPTTTMVFKDFPYPPDTPENVPHHVLAKYMHDYVAHFALQDLISFNTRVERVEQVPPEERETEGRKWRFTLRRLLDGGERDEFWTEDFDAFLIATGHYNAPLIPDLPGASEWFERWPEALRHTQGYRVPEPFEGKDVLIIGYGTSGIDIARDLSAARKVYIVTKSVVNGPEDFKQMRAFQRRLLPDNGEALPEIKRFIPPAEGEEVEQGKIELIDGRVVEGVSLVLFATGYQYSYPFLPKFHRDPSPSSAPTKAEKRHLLVTDGGGVLNLHRDVFFIPDPTIAFTGLSVNTAAFNFFEYQSLSAVRVWSGLARLPSPAEMWEEYEELIAAKGEGKYSHFMGKKGEIAYVRKAVEWLNAEAARVGAEPVEGHTAQWLAASEKSLESLALKYGLPLEILREKSGIADAKERLGLASGGSEGREKSKTTTEPLATGNADPRTGGSSNGNGKGATPNGSAAAVNGHAPPPPGVTVHAAA